MARQTVTHVTDIMRLRVLKNFYPTEYPGHSEWSRPPLGESRINRMEAEPMKAISPFLVSCTYLIAIAFLALAQETQIKEISKQDSVQQPKPMAFTQADRQRLIDAARHLKPEDVPALEQKAEAGDVEAQVVMGGAYNRGNVVPRDYGKALALFQKAAASGHPMAEESLGIMYVIGHGTQRNPAEAFKWFQKAAEHGYAQGVDDVGWMYYRGEGTERDPAKAVELFRKASELGSPSGMNRLGIAYAEGKGVSRDNVQAVSWFRKAAEAGDVQAQFNLAQKYDLGGGVQKDHTEVAIWYRKAAEQDYEPAQFDLAMAYHEGEGVPRDMQEAAKWFEKASNLGHAESTYYLARMYLQGSLGHDINTPRISLEKFQKAAEQGYPLAAMNFSEIYASWLMTGFLTDSERDYKQACRWLYIAQQLQERHQWNRIRPSDAKLVERNLPRKIKKIGKNLSVGDLTTCQREAAEWAKVHPTEPPLD
jgi:TPR repeat protein